MPNFENKDEYEKKKRLLENITKVTIFFIRCSLHKFISLLLGTVIHGN